MEYRSEPVVIRGGAGGNTEPKRGKRELRDYRYAAVKGRGKIDAPLLLLTLILLALYMYLCLLLLGYIYLPCNLLHNQTIRNPYLYLLHLLIDLLVCLFHIV